MPDEFEKKLTSTQRAYVAGFLDADGSISITGNTTRRGHQHWSLQLIFYNCNLEVLKKIQFWMGIGSIHSRKRTSKWRISYRLKFQGAAAARLLKAIHRYLIVKKKQAEIGLEFAKTIGPFALKGSSWQGGRKLKPAIIEKRKQLKINLQSLTLTANYLGKNHA